MGRGTATISVKSKDGSKTATCTINVEPRRYFEFSQTEMTLPIDEGCYTLELDTNYADLSEDDYNVYWESSDDDVISIDYCDDEYAELSLNAGGQATITAWDDLGNSATCQFTIQDDSLKLNTESITIDYKYDPYFEFDAGEPYCYYQNHNIGNIGEADWVEPTSGKITRVYSADPDIAEIKEVSWYEDSWVIIPKSVGTASIVCEGTKGDSQILKVVVPAAYINSYIKYYSGCYAPYGDGIRINAPAGSKVTISYGGKSYSQSVTGSSSHFNVPVRKVGTGITSWVAYGGTTYRFTSAVTNSATSIRTGTIYRSTGKTKVQLTNVHSGDIVYVKAGKKTIKKKIGKNYKSFSYTVKLPKKKTAGSKVKITVKNKFKQTMKTGSSKIWYASKVKKGMTKKQCKLVPGWDDPESWYRSGRWEIWYYDKNRNGLDLDSWLKFRNGRLYSWY